MKERVCVECGAVFYTEKEMGRFPLLCSDKCRKKRHTKQASESAARLHVQKPGYVKGSKNPPQEFHCIICKTVFWRVVFRCRPKPRTCSPTCRGFLGRDTKRERGKSKTD